ADAVDAARSPLHAAADRVGEPVDDAARPRVADRPRARAARVHDLVSAPEEVRHAIGQLRADHYRGRRRPPRTALPESPAAAAAEIARCARREQRVPVIEIRGIGTRVAAASTDYFAVGAGVASGFPFSTM